MSSSRRSDSLPALPSFRISTSDSRPVGQRPVAAMQLELQLAAIRRAEARAPAAIVQVDALERACAAPCPWSAPRRCRRRTAAPRRDPRAGSRRSPRPARRRPTSACACGTRTARRRSPRGSRASVARARPCSRHLRPRVPPRNCAPSRFRKMSQPATDSTSSAVSAPGLPVSALRVNCRTRSEPSAAGRLDAAAARAAARSNGSS